MFAGPACFGPRLVHEDPAALFRESAVLLGHIFKIKLLGQFFGKDLQVFARAGTVPVRAPGFQQSA